MPVALKKLGYADFLGFPDDGNRHEIVGGEWIMTPPPSSDHQAVVSKLGRLLGNHAEERGLGTLLPAPIGLILGRHDAVQPDLLFVSQARMSIIRKDGVHGAPDLVVEILSPSTAEYDRHEKLALYERSGVREYGMIDPAARTVEIREFVRTRRTRIYQAGQSFTSKVLPGLTVEVKSLFRSFPA